MLGSGPISRVAEDVVTISLENGALRRVKVRLESGSGVLLRASRGLGTRKLLLSILREQASETYGFSRIRIGILDRSSGFLVTMKPVGFGFGGDLLFRLDQKGKVFRVLYSGY
jgi:hypothetical protein